MENGRERMRGGGWKKVFRVAPYVLRHRYKYSVSILDYSLASILEYIITYYQKYQNSSDPDAWFEPNLTLIAYHITLSQQKVSTAPAPPPHYGLHNGSKPKFNSQRSESIADEICLMYNRLSGCVWKDKKREKCPSRHVCRLHFTALA